MAKVKPTAKVVNLNKAGVQFDPAAYTVRRADAPALYEFLKGCAQNGKERKHDRA